ncbi:MAG: ROK family protein [Rhodobacteraceae bacterium]|nr:ROK family protein [Paracoccaceae bacterium]
MNSAVMLVDIGGTNTRIAYLRSGRIGRVSRHPTKSLANAAATLRKIAADDGYRVAGVAMAAAGPVAGNRVRLTNVDVSVDARTVRRALRAKWAVLVNDMTATARAVPELRPVDLRTLHTGRGDPDAVRVVVAPGTGLGIGAVKRVHGKWCVIDGEGGHAAGPGANHIGTGRTGADQTNTSWEDLLSGPGLLRMYRRGGGRARSASEITTRAARGEARAKKVIARWCELLGRCCADMVLIFGARGGCYVAGGMVPSLGKQFDRAAFRTGYKTHRKFESYLRAVPVRQVIRPEPVLVGLRALVQDRGA